jgi:hypothetical protein
MELIILCVIAAAVAVAVSMSSGNDMHRSAEIIPSPAAQQRNRPRTPAPGFSTQEILVRYDGRQRDLYMRDDPACIYPRYHSKVGIHKRGRNFPAMVTRHHFESRGYLVLKDYLLVRCCRQRESNAGFHFLCTLMGEEKLRTVIREAGNLRGGDPDLFVYKEDLSDYFFVEVKEKDQLMDNQLRLLPIIERHLCPVHVVRVRQH